MSEAPYWTVPHLCSRNRRLLMGLVAAIKGVLRLQVAHAICLSRQVLVEEFLHPDILYLLILLALSGRYGHELGCILLG